VVSELGAVVGHAEAAAAAPEEAGDQGTVGFAGVDQLCIGCLNTDAA